jgi:hypothetical protein
MSIIETIRKNKLVFALLLVFLFLLFSKSTCNGKTGYGLCYTQDGKVIHFSPLNMILS